VSLNVLERELVESARRLNDLKLDLRRLRFFARWIQGEAYQMWITTPAGERRVSHATILGWSRSGWVHEIARTRAGITWKITGEHLGRLALEESDEH
jgi:hypothetical protein